MGRERLTRPNSSVRSSSRSRAILVSEAGALLTVLGVSEVAQAWARGQSMAFVPIERLRVDRDFAEGLPSGSEGELEGLVEDIRTRGILVDLIVTSDFLLLDGHRRYQAAQRLGLREVPVKTLECSGEPEWGKALLLALNLCRRHLSEAHRAVLGSSLLRLERLKARERQREGLERGRQTRWGEAVGLDDAEADPERPADRSTERVAKVVGISRQSLERVEAVKSRAPEMLQRMLEGAVSIAAAYRAVRIEELREKSACEESAGSGLLSELEAVFGRVPHGLHGRSVAKSR